MVHYPHEISILRVVTHNCRPLKGLASTKNTFFVLCVNLSFQPLPLCVWSVCVGNNKKLDVSVKSLSQVIRGIYVGGLSTLCYIGGVVSFYVGECIYVVSL